jgi:hypothetical protein
MEPHRQRPEADMLHKVKNGSWKAEIGLEKQKHRARKAWSMSTSFVSILKSMETIGSLF